MKAKKQYDGVPDYWVSYYKKSGSYSVAFRDSSGLIRFDFTPCHVGVYVIHVRLPPLRSDGCGPVHSFSDANYWMEKAVLIMRDRVPCYPDVPDSVAE